MLLEVAGSVLRGSKYVHIKGHLHEQCLYGVVPSGNNGTPFSEGK